MKVRVEPQAIEVLEDDGMKLDRNLVDASYIAVIMEAGMT